MAEFQRDAACIVGIGHSAYGKAGELAERGDLRLALDAICDACHDAGLDPKDIDGFSGFSEHTFFPAELAVALGTPNFDYSASVWGGRGSGLPTAVANAYIAVSTGMAKHVAVVRSLTQARRLGRSVAPGVQPGEPIPLWFSYSAPFGMVVPMGWYALKVRRHMSLYGTTTGHLAEVAINARRNAVNNPDARFRTEITVDDHHRSRLIADPLRLFDVCMESDGAAAFVVTTPERAQDLRHHPVSIRAIGTRAEYKWGINSFNVPGELLASTGARRAAEQLYARAGMGPSDVDVVLISEASTFSVIAAIEDFGFCGIGEGGPFVAGGGIRREGPVPVNTHGGSLAEVYLQGASHVLEAVRQLRGTSCNQVDGAETALYVSTVGAAPGGGVLLCR